MTKNKKIALLLIFTLIVVIILFFFLKKEPAEEREVTVVTTTYPLASLVEEIGGERVEVVNITPSGRSPLEYSPPRRSINRIKEADLLLYNGAGLEPWVREKKEEIEESTIVVETSSYFQAIKTEEGEDNPHFWTDPLFLNEKAKIILKKLIEIDEEGEDYYQRNAKRVFALLEELHVKYKRELSSCKSKEINFPDNTLDYLGRRYNFNINQKSSEEAVDITILLNPSRREIGEEDYFSISRENLQKLKEAMGCR